MNAVDSVIDFLLDRERSRSVLMFLFFIDILVTTLVTMWSPSVQGVLAMFGMYLMLLIPLLVLYRQRHPVEERVIGD